MKIVILILFLTTSAFADTLSGTWTGAGTTTDSRGNTSPCSNVTMQIVATDSKITIQHYTATCGAMQPDWGPLVFKIKNGKVYTDEDGEVGTFDGSLFKTLLPDTACDYAMNFQLKGNTLSTYYGVRSSLGAIVIEGDLTKDSK